MQGSWEIVPLADYKDVSLFRVLVCLVLRFPTRIKFLSAYGIHDVKSKQQFVWSMVAEQKEEVGLVSVFFSPPRLCGYPRIMANHLLKRKRPILKKNR